MTASPLYLWGYSVRGLSISWPMETIVKERPILFSGAIVRALLAGTKTQTRRAMKPQPEIGYGGLLWWHYSKHEGTANNEPGQPAESWLEKCPYGQPGDRLWVRESSYHFGYWGGHMDITDEWEDEWHSLLAAVPRHFAADGPCPAIDVEPFVKLDSRARHAKWRSTPSIHLRRADCRILVEIVSVRVERLQSISEADAVAEGIEQTEAWGGDWTWYQDYLSESNQVQARESYESLWRKINGLESWAANPWVWVVEFKVIVPAPSSTIQGTTQN